MNKNYISGSKPPRVRVIKHDAIILYEVTEDELQTLIKDGPSETLYLTLMIFSISLATAFLIALLTTTISLLIYSIFIIASALGYSLGIVFIVIWLKKRKLVNYTISKMYERWKEI